MSSEKPAENKAAGGAGKPSMAGKLVMPLFAAVNLAVVGAGVFLTYKSTLAYHPPTTNEMSAEKELNKERKEAPGISDRVMFTMPAFTVNLAGTPRRLIRVEMTFEMLDKEGFEESCATARARATKSCASSTAKPSTTLKRFKETLPQRPNRRFAKSSDAHGRSEGHLLQRIPRTIKTRKARPLPLNALLRSPHVSTMLTRCLATCHD